MEAFFLDAPTGRTGQRFCIHHEPVGPLRGALVYLHPLGDEMNKSRRMAALQARALADAGFAVLQIDLAGCGDSSGDFSSASWDDWVDDGVLALRWMHAHHGAPLSIWGLRAGCLVAVQAAARFDQVVSLLLWQPASSGQTLLAQMLRLRSAAGIAAEAPREALPDARAEWAAGRPVEIAGYGFAPALAEGLAQARLVPPPNVQACVWLECGTREPPEPLPASMQAAAAWRQALARFTIGAVTGPAFWQTQEIEEAPALLAASVQAMLDMVAPPMHAEALP